MGAAAAAGPRGGSHAATAGSGQRGRPGDGQARLLFEQAKTSTRGDAARYGEALAAAKKALALARPDEASDEVRREAADLVATLADEAGAAERDRLLLAVLLEVRRPREGLRFQRDDKGLMVELAEPSADEQFAAAFRAWGLDVDATPTAEARARLAGRPAAVVAEAVAALDEWANDRRQQRMPRAERRRVAELAAALDDPKSQCAELRVLLDRGKLGQERALAVLSLALRPVPVPFDIGPGEDRRVCAAWRRKPSRGGACARLADPGAALRGAGEDALAERLLQAAVRARPQEVVLYTALGRLREGQRPPRWGEVVECYAAARALRPELGETLADALVESGRADEGLALYEQLVAQVPDSPWLHARRGHALLLQRRYTEAEADYRAALRLQPNDADAHNNLANVLSQQDRNKEAEEEARTAMRLQPKTPGGYYSLGMALEQQGRYKEAEAANRTVLFLRPDYAEAHTHLGNDLAKQGRYKEAEAAFRTAIRLKPELPQAHLGLSNCCENDGRYKEAEAESRKTLRLQPGYSEAYNNLGNALDDQGLYKEAEAEYREAIRLNPKNTACISTSDSPWTIRAGTRNRRPPIGKLSDSGPTTPRRTATSATPCATRGASRRPWRSCAGAMP